MISSDQPSWAIEKILSPNDVGETGSHQSGILVPKQPDILRWFPPLEESAKNPRLNMKFMDENGSEWIFVYIHYNNAQFGGTRNEYRLTRLTKFIKTNALNSGDRIHLSLKSDGTRMISCIYEKPAANHHEVDRDGIPIGTHWVAYPVRGRK